MKRWLLLALAGGWLGTAVAAELPPGLMVLDGRAAPPLRLADMDGRVIDLAELRGGWVFVHFWASWCLPCRREMPTIGRLATSIPPERLRVLLVNTAEDEDSVLSFLGIVAPDLESFLDRDGQVTERWQPRGLPSTFLVDPDGRLRYLALGGRPWDTEAYLRFLREITRPR